MGNLKHLIVSATRKEKASDTSLVKSLLNLGILNLDHKNPSVQCQVACRNTQGLSKLYQNFFENNRESFDIITYIHDDVEILDKKMLFTIEKAFSDHPHWDILGVAGIIKQDIKTILETYSSNFSATWINSPRRPQDWAGLVWHRHQENVWPSNYGNYDVDASIVDGVFLSFRVNSFKELPFDLDFDFHHYDLALCVNASLLEYNIGIFHTPIIHESMGSYADPNWMYSNKKFLSKYLSLIK